jgi:hypothetical protein
MQVFNTMISQYKASLYEIARSVLKSRDRLVQREQQLIQENRSLLVLHQELTEQLAAANEQAQQARQIVELQRSEIQQLRNRPLRLPPELLVPGHQFGPKMICLCMMLVQKVGFRPSESALQIIFDFLGIEDKVPSHDSMRTWACRLGVAIISREDERVDDELWFADHSNQIGAEKVFSVLAIRESELPPVGQTLSRSQFKPIHVAVAKDWKTEDVRKHYQALAQKRGKPRALITDGASELRDSADVLQKPGENLFLIRDMKHKAANIFEQLIGKDARFGEYQSQLGKTRSQIQQTELSHLTSPKQKPKARFMNLGPILCWGQMISHHLSHPHSKARQGISPARMTQKLGWVRGFRSDLTRWSDCQRVMQECLSYVGRHGVSAGCATMMRCSMENSFSNWAGVGELAKTMAERLVQYVELIEAELKAGQRMWVLTDNLESSFGAFKQLEGQHSKSGFTGLVAAMPMLLTDLNPEMVRESLIAVPVSKMRAWVKEHLGRTLASKRNQAYAEFRQSHVGC